MANVILKGFIVISDDDNKTQVQEALEEHIVLTRQEAGCLVFDVMPDEYNSCKYWVYEKFVSKEAFEIHQDRVRSSVWGRVSADVQRFYEPLIELVEF